MIEKYIIVFCMAKVYWYQTLFFIIFLWVLSYTFWDEYIEFQKSQRVQQEYQVFLIDSNTTFQHSWLIKLWDDTQLHHTPDLEFLEKLVIDIDQAKERVWLEVYIFTEKRILQALLRAHHRGIDVKVLLENNPYMIPNINDKHYEILKESWIPVKWSDPLNYALNHSKFIIVDDTCYISTGNYSFASFKSNRDIFLEVQHPDIVRELVTLFTHDYTHQPFWVMHPNIVLSPDNSRAKIQSLFEEAQDRIAMYFPYMSDMKLLELVIETAKRWIRIDFVIWEDTQENSIEEIRELQEAWVRLYFMKNPKLHAKAILMDEKILYIGSINFSRHSMDSNRELGLLLTDRHIIKDFLNIFSHDMWSNQ